MDNAPQQPQTGLSDADRDFLASAFRQAASAQGDRIVAAINPELFQAILRSSQKNESKLDSLDLNTRPIRDMGATLNRLGDSIDDLTREMSELSRVQNQTLGALERIADKVGGGGILDDMGKIGAFATMWELAKRGVSGTLKYGSSLLGGAVTLGGEALEAIGAGGLASTAALAGGFLVASTSPAGSQQEIDLDKLSPPARQKVLEGGMRVGSISPEGTKKELDMSDSDRLKEAEKMFTQYGAKFDKEKMKDLSEEDKTLVKFLQDQNKDLLDRLSKRFKVDPESIKKDLKEYFPDSQSNPNGDKQSSLQNRGVQVASLDSSFLPKEVADAVTKDTAEKSDAMSSNDIKDALRAGFDRSEQQRSGTVVYKADKIVFDANSITLTSDEQNKLSKSLQDLVEPSVDRKESQESTESESDKDLRFRNMIEEILNNLVTPLQGAFPGAPMGVGPGGARKTLPSKDIAVSKDISAEGKALLDLIASGESGGNYGAINYMAGGGEVSDFSQHPFAGKVGYTAAGRYQQLASNFERYAKKLGLKDWSKESQDLAAWAQANDDYKARTGRNLEEDLKSQDPDMINNIKRALSPTWHALAGMGDVSSSYAGALKRQQTATSAAIKPEEATMAKARQLETMSEKTTAQPPVVVMPSFAGGLPYTSEQPSVNPNATTLNYGKQYEPGDTGRVAPFDEELRKLFPHLSGGSWGHN